MMFLEKIINTPYVNKNMIGNHIEGIAVCV
jgi:hypothetical protein